MGCGLVGSGHWQRLRNSFKALGRLSHIMPYKMKYIQVVVTKCNLEETGDCRSLKCFLAIMLLLIKIIVHSIRILHITPFCESLRSLFFRPEIGCLGKFYYKLISQPRVLKRLPLAFGVVDGEVNGLRSKLFWQF